MKYSPDGRAGILSEASPTSPVKRQQCRWLVRLIVAGCIVAGLPGQTGSLTSQEAKVLESGKTIQGELQAGQSHEYQFQLGAGEYARVLVEQRSVDVAVTSTGPGGQELFSADSAVIGDAESVELIGEVAGVYRLRLTTAQAHAMAGRYEIALHEIGAGTDRHKMRIAAARAFATGMNSRRVGTRDAFLQAIAQVEQALSHWRAAQDRIEEASALFMIGLLYIEIGDRQKALEYSSQGLDAAQSTLDRKTIGRALEALGRVHNNFGDKRKAIEYCEQALPLLQAVNDRAGEGNALDNAAVAYAGTGEKRKALIYYDRAVQIFRELHDRQLLAELAGNIGVTYDNLGEYQRALESHESELVLVRELADRPSEAVTLNNIGSAYSGLGEYQKALDAYNAALELNRSLDNQWNAAINLNNIAWAYGQLGDRRHALSFYQNSLELVRKVKDQRRMAITLNNIADIYTELGDFAKAVETHGEALVLRRAAGDADGEANSLVNLGRTYAKMGQRQKAREHFERAIEIHRRLGNRYMLARALRSIGVLDREAGNPETARSSLNEALQISRAIRDRKGEAETLSELAKAERDRSNLADAHELASKALTTLESIRLGVTSPSLRASLVASTREVQEFQIEMLMRLHAQQPAKGFGAAALVASERGRARSLLEMLGESGAEIRRGVDPALLARELEVGRLISAKAELQTRLLGAKHTDAEASSAEKELDGLAVELEQVQSRIRHTSPQYAALIQPEPLDLKQIQGQVLDGNTVLLEYALGRGTSYLWAVTESSMDVYELPARAEIESAARRVYELLTARNQRPQKETPAARIARIRQADAEYWATARKLSSLLLGPAASHLGKKRLLIVGEGALHYLPFGALPEPGADTPLMVNHEMVTAPSASVVAVLRQETAGRKPAAKALAVLADAVFYADDVRIAATNRAALRTGSEPVTQEFLRLRFSRTEAEEITRLAGAAGTLKALDFEASRETAMSPGLAEYRVVHFATHSLLNNEHPELSGVVLSLVDRNGRPQNGFLRLYDIYNLRLGADLVVLSACRTALGEEIWGEGLIGLTRGFLYAGAPRVVATLWEIDDRTTAEAMKRFYEGMLGRKERPAEALRGVQIALWKTNGLEAPYYWAAFTLEGEWR